MNIGSQVGLSAKSSRQYDFQQEPQEQHKILTCTTEITSTLNQKKSTYHSHINILHIAYSLLPRGMISNRTASSIKWQRK